MPTPARADSLVARVMITSPIRRVLAGAWTRGQQAGGCAGLRPPSTSTIVQAAVPRRADVVRFGPHPVDTGRSRSGAIANGNAEGIRHAPRPRTHRVSGSF